MAENASITSVVPTCSFCGVEKSAEVPLIAGNDGHICEQCVKLAFQVVSSWGRKAVTIEPELKTPAGTQRSCARRSPGSSSPGSQERMPSLRL